MRLREFEIKRERRLEVGECLGDQRDAVVALRGQRLKFEFSHVSLRLPIEYGSALFNKPSNPTGLATQDQIRSASASVATARPQMHLAGSASVY